MRSSKDAPVQVSFLENLPSQVSTISEPVLQKKTLSCSSRDLNAVRAGTTLTATNAPHSPKSPSRQSRSPRPHSSKETNPPAIHKTRQYSPPPYVAPSRYSQKGLDTSSAMLEFFSGKSVVGSGSCFQFIETSSKATTKATTNVSEERDSEESVGMQRKISDHNENEIIVETKEALKRKKSNKKEEFISSEPGPEYYEEAETYLNGDDMQRTNEEEVTLKKSESSAFDVKQDNQTLSPPKVTEWEDATENVLECKTGAQSGPLNECLKETRAGEPGPENYEEFDEDAANGVTSFGDTQGRTEEEEHSLGREAEPCSAQCENGTSAVNKPAQDMPVAATPPILIKGAQIVNDDSIFNADVLVEDKIIKQVSTSIEASSGVTVIDGSGKLLLPAGIDVHTEFSSPDCVDDFAAGSRAALAGGTATVIDVVIPVASESVLSAFDRVRKNAESKSLCNFGLSVVISAWNDSIKKEMSIIVKDKGVNSFIIDLYSDDQLYQAFEFCKTLGVHARIVPQNKNIISFLERKMLSLGITGPEGYLQSRPELLEAEFLGRASVISQLTNCPLSVMSISSSEARDAVLRSRSTNALLFPEVSVAALASDGTHYFNKCARHAAAHLTACPLRLDPRTPYLLLECLSNSSLCVCASEHRGLRDRVTGNFTQMPVGVSAAEERMSVIWEKAVYSGRIDPMRFVAVTSSNAAKIFNLYPKKGRIAVGADADLVLWDPNAKRKFSVKSQQSQSDFSIFESFTVHATPILTICDGRVAYNDGKFDSEFGHYVQTAPHSPYLFCIVQQRERVQIPEKVERDDSSNARRSSANWRELPDSRPQPAVNSRNQFDSNFSVSGAPVDDARSIRASTKVLNPPGGRSTGFW